MKKLVSVASILVCTSVFSVSAETVDELDAMESASEHQADRTNKFQPIVLPFYDPSIKSGVSAIPLFAFYPDDDDLVSDASTIAVPLIYTSNGSYVAKVAGDIILFEDNFRVSFETGFTSTNLNFNGTEGNKEQMDFDADFMFKVAEDMFVGIGGIYESSRYTAKHGNEQSSLDDMGFSSDYESDTGYRLSFQWDTREQFYYPHSGYMWQLNFEDHAKWLGNNEDNTYQSLFSDYRYFYSLDEQSHQIIATKLVGRYLFDADKAPSSAFTTYGRQGKEVQRGYAQGDYIASNMLNLEVEYRHQFSGSQYDFVNSSSVVAIGGIGKSFGEKLEGYEEDFRDSEWLGVVGVGYRYTILPYERLNIKVDVTYNSDGDTIAYFGFGESI
ncbi:hypothetical protein K6U44_16190 [Vibrio parahaemolyticus]|uniref:hypothetical protein n=1 Tax=Vibrio parahaemolyticus TaxID=670 RepID=UPI001EEA3E42|nr:hypothetical protein [Vibrio parahaemolyticus]MCG6461955.1 hypothetical protein [Vibrio parahaemolyticus]